MTAKTAALVGAAGGVGTTRTTVECAAVLAAAGHDVAVLDAAYATQGLVSYVDHDPPDITRVVTGAAELDDAFDPLATEASGRVAVAPARAPFERVARAKAPEAAQRLDEAVAAATLPHDTVLVDVPPVAANQAVAATNAADRVVVVTVDTERGADALARTRERLADVGCAAVATVVTRTDEPTTVTEADAAVPTADSRRARDAPAALPLDRRGGIASAVVEAAEAILGAEVDVDPADGWLGGLP